MSKADVNAFVDEAIAAPGRVKCETCRSAAAAQLVREVLEASAKRGRRPSYDQIHAFVVRQVPDYRAQAKSLARHVKLHEAALLAEIEGHD